MTTSLSAMSGARAAASRSVCEPSALPGKTLSRSIEFGESIQELRRSTSAARAFAVKMTRSRPVSWETGRSQNILIASADQGPSSPCVPAIRVARVPVVPASPNFRGMCWAAAWAVTRSSFHRSES